MIQSIQPITAIKHTEQLTHQAQKLVAQTFYGTLMKQMHDSPFKSQLMDGGRGGQAFQPLMDQHLIDRMAKSSGKKAGRLIHSVVHRLERNNVNQNRMPGVSTELNRFAPRLIPEMRSHVAPGLRA